MMKVYGRGEEGGSRDGDGLGDRLKNLSY